MVHSDEHYYLVLLQVFEGNTDSYSVKHSYLDEPIVARFIKFHTVQWNRHPSMRVEILGCQCEFILLHKFFLSGLITELNNFEIPFYIHVMCHFFVGILF